MPASNAGTTKGSNASGPELVISRVFDAPRALVFKVWTDPKHLEQWWGPRGFTTKIVELDLRVGGAFHYVMHGPDGNDYPFSGTYVEIVEPHRLVIDGKIHGDLGQDVWTEIVFAEHEGKTKVTVRQVFSFESAATRGAPIGWNQQLDRLTEYLANL